MKKPLMVLLLLCNALIATAQLPAKSIYNIRIKDLPDDKALNTEADSGKLFYLAVDTAGLATDSLRLLTVLLQQGDKAAADYTAHVNKDSFVLSGTSALKFRFILCHTTDSLGNCGTYTERSAVFQRKAATGTTAVPAINNALTALQNDKDNEKPVGYFTRKSPAVLTGDTNRKAEVRCIEIALGNGAIAKRGLVVTLDNGQKFVNWRSPISLARFAKRNDKLYAKNPALSSQYIRVSDVLDYSYFYKFSYPEDSYYTLSKDKVTDTLKVGASINQLIEVRIYTDLLGLLGRKANGLIQTEISGNFISNSTSVPETDITFHTFVKPYFRLSKLDSKFSSLDTAHIEKVPGKADAVNRVYLNQIAYLQAGIKTNIVRFGIGVNQEIFVNAGLDINLVNADSLYQKDISFINYYPEVEYRINRLSNFGLEFGSRMYWQYLTKTAPFSNKGSEQILHFYSTINYYPFSNTNSKIYLRFSGFTSVKASDYSFTQFQFGVKTGLFASK